MNLVALFFREPASLAAGPCGHCAFFNNDPHYLEAQIPGLRSLSSATGSVRSDDGLCARHGRYLSARAGCGSFEPKHPLDVDHKID